MVCHVFAEGIVTYQKRKCVVSRADRQHPHLPTAMADVQAPPAQVAPTAPDAAAEPPAQNEVASETLYIQNLNEKIKVDGQHPR
jgi:uncharacterized membrane protein